MIRVSTPSRICLFGEHQDYLGLDVVALAIDLRFSAEVTPREDNLIRIAIRDKRIDKLNEENAQDAYERHEIDLSAPIEYRKNRDYLRSTVKTLLEQGYPLRGADIRMDSTIPIGKGMCSSSTMVVALVKALLEQTGSPDKDDPARIAWLGYASEVLAFNEPGGMMDHYTSALGGLLHMSFATGDAEVTPLDYKVEGCFILFDSLEQKDTTRILAESKIPTLEAVEQLASHGITSVRDFYDDPGREDLLSGLDEFHRRKLRANINNYRILRTALEGFAGGISPRALGELITRHQENLRDGLGISTPKVDHILETALANGAYGGKINGSGGGGCCYAYAPVDRAPAIVEAAERLGYPAKILRADTGVRID